MPTDHYIPRVYLKPFTFDGNHLFVYVKAKDELQPKVSTKSVGCEAEFYTLPTDLVGIGEERVWEDALQQVDHGFADIRDELESLVKSGHGVGDDLRERLANYLGQQILRTRLYRDSMKAALEEGLSRGGYRPPREPWATDGRLSRDLVAYLHATHLAREPRASITRYLYSLPWFLGINCTPRKFYTSDFPVVWQRRERRRGPGSSMSVVGDEFAFPVTPTLILLMYWGPLHQWAETHPYPHLALTEDEVVSYNNLQIAQSHLRVFSQEDHGRVCRNFCAALPEVRDPERHKKQAVATMNTDEARQVEAEVKAKEAAGLPSTGPSPT